MPSRNDAGSIMLHNILTAELYTWTLQENPIIETIITPREGFKLVVRNSKGIGQEEYFVEAVEIVSSRPASFCSLERPKCFMVPVSDYELLEAREARIVLKNVGMDSTIKIAGGREGCSATSSCTCRARTRTCRKS